MISIIAWIGAIAGCVALVAAFVQPVPAEKRTKIRLQGFAFFCVGMLCLLFESLRH